MKRAARRAALLLAAATAAACGDARQEPSVASAPPGAAPAALAGIVRESEASGRSVIAGSDGWLFLLAELRHLAAGRFWGDDAQRASRAPKPEWKDPLPAILDFRDQLQRAGIDLLVVPVPAKVSIVPAALPALAALAPGERIDASDVEFFELLRARGVEVLDLQRELARPGDRPTFCKTDSHWSGAGIERAAAQIAERVKRLAWYESVPKQRFSSLLREIEIQGDLGRMAGTQPAPSEKLALRFVGSPGAAPDDLPTPVPPSRASPLLLLGDSHALVFQAGGDMFAQGAGLADQLALELGFAVDLVAVRGSGATPARINLARRTDGLAGKRLLVWCFGARELTEAAQGWAKVPVVR